jgi:hypothetical protein
MLARGVEGSGWAAWLRAVHGAVVVLGVAVAVVPSVVLIAYMAPLWLLTLPVQPAWLIALYVSAWCGLGALAKLFMWLFGKANSVGAVAWLGLAAGVLAAGWNTWERLSQVTKTCRSCVPALELLAYNPYTLCIVVAIHWTYMHAKGVRLVGHS